MAEEPPKIKEPEPPQASHDKPIMTSPGAAGPAAAAEIWDENIVVAEEIAAQRPLPAPAPPAWSRDSRSAGLLLDAEFGHVDLAAFIDRLAAALTADGLPLARLNTGFLTLHPQIYARTLFWSVEQGTLVTDRGFDIEVSEFYRASPVRLIHRGAEGFRCRLEGPLAPGAFPILHELKAAGATDYYIRPLDFAGVRRSFLSMATARPGGFTAAELERLDALLPLIAMRLETIVLRVMTGDLLTLYLGRDAARRVAAGAVRRGEGRLIRSALLTCDMRGFTRMSDLLPASEMIDILDRYLDIVTLAVHRAGGEVLKFLGDGLLASFPADEGTGEAATPRQAAGAALRAAREALAELAEFDDLPAQLGAARLRTGFALNFGDVVYGNIGSRARLDFTVIGPVVNEVARLEALCKTLDRPLLTTRAFAEALGGGLRSLGVHVLRGKRQPTEVFSGLDD